MSNLRYLLVGLFVLFQAFGLQAQLLNELVSITSRDFIYWNPATIAMDDRPSVGLIYKDVHMGLDHSPLHYAVNYQLPIRFQNSAFSAILSKDFIGDLRRTNISLGYRYTLLTHRLEDQKFYLGLSTDFMQDRLLASNHFARDIDDPLVLLENENAYGIDVNVGLFYSKYFRSENLLGSSTLSGGISLKNIIGSTTTYAEDGIRSAQPKHLFTLISWEKDVPLFDLELKYYNSLSFSGYMNHTMLVSLKDIAYQSFTMGYSTSKDIIVAWGFDMTDFDDSKIEADLSLFYGIDELLFKNKHGIQLSVKYLFRPKPWSTSDFR